MLQLKGNFDAALLLLAVLVFGYVQISLGLGALKWDLVDVVFPFRYFFSESMGAGYFPFWNPFQQTGTPFYADLQAPTYYPELWIVTVLGGYTIYTMHALFIAYLFIAEGGMYLLVQEETKSVSAGLLAGLAYAFSGFMVGHGQHFFLLVGAAWMPFIVRSYLSMSRSLKIEEALKAALFTFLLLTGGYQALSLVMFYLLIGLFAWFVWNEMLVRKRIVVLLKVNAIYALVTLVLCLPLICATVEIMPLVDRLSGGIELDETLSYG